MRITLTFQQFNLKEFSACECCRCDSVKIYDGNSTSANQMGVSNGVSNECGYCGSCLPPTLTSTGKIVVIDFVSDWSGQNSGFYITYRGKLILDAIAIGI